MFGMKDGKFFECVDAHVDKKKAPGMSTLPKPTLWTWLAGAPFVMSHTPNTIWAVIALAFYFMFPYDLSAQGSAFRSPLSITFFKVLKPYRKFPDNTSKVL